MTRATENRLILWFWVAVLCIVLAGCTTDGVTPKAVCDALLGPIRYNSTNPKSERFAGRKLAPDIAEHNRVGTNLACPAYRRW